MQFSVQSYESVYQFYQCSVWCVWARWTCQATQTFTEIQCSAVGRTFWRHKLGTWFTTAGPGLLWSSGRCNDGCSALVLWWYCEQSHQKHIYKQVCVLPSLLVCRHSWTNPLNRLIYFVKWVSFQICQHHDMSPLRRIGPLIPKMKLLHPYDTSFLPQANLYSLECAKMMAILRINPYNLFVTWQQFVRGWPWGPPSSSVKAALPLKNRKSGKRKKGLLGRKS